MPNKSYGLQVALIVWGPGIEICFCLGSGTGQINNADARNKSEMALAQLKMGLQRLPLELRRDLGNAISQNWSLRKRWKLGPGDSDFETFDQWLQFAATSEGGACISKYWLPEQLTKNVDIAQGFYSACSFFQPLLDAAYAEVPTSNESTPTFLQLMRPYVIPRRPESSSPANQASPTARASSSLSPEVVASVATKMSAIPQTTPSQVNFSLSGFDRRKRIGTNESLLNQAIAALAAASPTIHAPDDVFARGDAAWTA